MHAEAPSVEEASDLSAAAMNMAIKAASKKKSSFVDGLRWVMVFAMLVLIRFLACRCETLRDIRLAHVVAHDDADSPVGAVFRIFIPKTKGDPLGSNGGAAMRAVSYWLGISVASWCPSLHFVVQYPQMYNSYLCPQLALSLYFLICRPYITAAYDQQFDHFMSEESEHFTAKRRATRPSTEEIEARALRSLYLFPLIDAAGTMHFTEPSKSDTVRRYLGQVAEEAGYGDRGFTWHGVVSVFVRATCDCLTLTTVSSTVQ